MEDNPPQPGSTESGSTKWNCLSSQVNLKSIIKENFVAFAIILMTLTIITIAIGVGFGVDWQRSSYEGPCICAEGKLKNILVFQKC